MLNLFIKIHLLFQKNVRILSDYCKSINFRCIQFLQFLPTGQIRGYLFSHISYCAKAKKNVLFGQPDLCHPKYKFPEGWNVTHSENHWSNEQTMQEYAENVLILYVESVVDEYPLNHKIRKCCAYLTCLLRTEWIRSKTS